MRIALAPGLEGSHLTLSHPVANLFKIAHRRTREGERVEVRRRSKLGCKGDSLVSSCLGCCPSHCPPAFMSFEMRSPYGIARIGHLWALFVSDARMDVTAMGGGDSKRIRSIIQQTFRDADPVAEVASKP